MTEESAGKPALSVVIPNYNGAAVLGDAIDSAYAAAGSWPAGALEVIVPDDGSTDGSPEWVERRWPAVRVLRNERNLGFAGNCHRGVAAAAHPWVFLMNSDMRVSPDTFDRLFEAWFLHADLPLFALQPEVVYPDERGLNYGRTAVRLVRGRMERWQPESDGGVQPTLYAIGGAMFLDKARFLALGGFDLAFSPYYGEDLDVCFRAWRRGWPSLYVPGARAVHLEGQTIGKEVPDRVRLIYERNLLLVAWRNLDAPGQTLSMALWAPARILSLAGRGNVIGLRTWIQLLARCRAIARGRGNGGERRFSSQEVMTLSAADELPRDLLRSAAGSP